MLALLACAASDDDDSAGADTETSTASTTQPSSSSDPDSTEGDPLPESSDTAEPGEDATSDENGESTTDTAGPPQLPPTDGAALLPWLEAGSYTGWTAESGPHPSAGPHGSGGVLTFVNDALFASLDAGNGEHPQDAAVVKELFAGDGSISGWAVMVKVEPGQGGASWYWYEIVGTSTYADGIDEGLCTGCHSGGVDQVLTPFPLQ
ncbi:MAG: hypothetical protein IAG13_21660 [Deltaproteobacteria bacterium]|nr:hypothetical protein [Nannocystaceae bacterium]